jgi:N6-adenosine-specific RNA methylase IME4
VKFNVIVADMPWSFTDSLTMSDIKRGSESQYKTLSIDSMKGIPVSDIAADDSILALWVVGSQLQAGLDIMESWGFRQTQTWVWVKTKKNPLGKLLKDIIDKLLIGFCGSTKDKERELNIQTSIVDSFAVIEDALKSFDLHNILNFNMGRLFRQTHEICLIGVRGKIYSKLKNKSQRSVCFDAPKKHSTKTEYLQDRLEIMFGDVNYLELFARRQRPGWECVGNEMTLSEDIFDSIKRLKGL